MKDSPSPAVASNSAKQVEGILPIAKPKGQTAFSLVRQLRRHLGVRKIGHAGTLDPFATGVMILMVGRYTRFSNQLLNQDKEYIGRLRLGVETDSFDTDGQIIRQSNEIPTSEQILEAIAHFQGNQQQIPPMFSAKKINGKKLCELARRGIEVEREPVTVSLQTELIDYHYPYLDIRVACSKGTYIRALAHDIGRHLGCGAHLESLIRTRSGSFTLEDCFDGERLKEKSLNLNELQHYILVYRENLLPN